MIERIGFGRLPRGSARHAWPAMRLWCSRAVRDACPGAARGASSAKAAAACGGGSGRQLTVPPDLPATRAAYWKWYACLSYMRYAWGAAVINQFSAAPPQAWLAGYGDVSGEVPWRGVGSLCCPACLASCPTEPHRRVGSCRTRGFHAGALLPSPRRPLCCLTINWRGGRRGPCWASRAPSFWPICSWRARRCGRERLPRWRATLGSACSMASVRSMAGKPNGASAHSSASSSSAAGRQQLPADAAV